MARSLHGGTLLSVVALAACRATSSAPAGPPPSRDASVAPPTPTFACGERPSCPAEHPTGERRLVDAIRAAAGAGKIDQAAGLVACARDAGLRVRLEPDPGFSEATPSPDSKHLIAPLPRDGRVRLFDTRTWTETLQIDDVAHVEALHPNLVLVSQLGDRPPTIWDLDQQVARPSAIPSRASARVSQRGTAAYWVERAPRTVLAIMLNADPENVVRLPIDGTDSPLLRELPEGRFLASSGEGRHWVIDGAKVVRTFAARQSRIARVALADRSVGLFDVGALIEGVDEQFFAPARPPLVVPLVGTAAPRPLTGPGCPRSVVLAVSDDGALAVTRAKEAWCLFDVATGSLVGTAPAPMLRGGKRFISVGAFVGPNVAVVGLGGRMAHLRVASGKTPALVDVEPIEGEAHLLQTSDAPNSYGFDPVLVDVPRDRAWVGVKDAAGRSSIMAFRADGTTETRTIPLDVTPVSRWTPLTDPRRERVIGMAVPGKVRACLLETPGGCVDLALGGTYEVAPDGTWAAGPLPVGDTQWTTPAFKAKRGALAVVEVATGRELVRRHAPGFVAVRFTSENDLALFGEDGALLSCTLGGACTTIAVRPHAGIVLSDSSTLVVADTTTVSSVPALKIDVGADRVASSPTERARERDLFHVGRGVLIKPTHDKLLVTDPKTGTTLRDMPIDSPAILAGAASAPRVAALSRSELAVFDIEAGKKAFGKSFPTSMIGPVGVLAINAEGTRVALAREGLSIFDAVGGKEHARWSLETEYPNAVGISPDGRWVATVVEIPSVKGHVEPNDPKDAILVMGDANAAKPERIPLGRVTERGSGGAISISITNAGRVAVTFANGRAVLIEERRVTELSRDARDEGLWLSPNDGTASALGRVRPDSHGLTCRLALSVLPAAACLPALCR